MAGVAGSTESLDRRDGWTDRGTGLVLADGATWHLPTIDDGLIPHLPGLVGAIAVVHRLDDHYQKTGVPPAQLIAMLGLYLIEALTVQYRTDREALAGLIPPALAAALTTHPDEDMFVASHIDDVWEYAIRRRFVRPDGSPACPSLN